MFSPKEKEGGKHSFSFFMYSLVVFFFFFLNFGFQILAHV